MKIFIVTILTLLEIWLFITPELLDPCYGVKGICDDFCGFALLGDKIRFYGLFFIGAQMTIIGYFLIRDVSHNHEEA